MKSKLIIGLIFMSLIVLSGCSCIQSYRTVESVGGCDRRYCAAKFTDGTIGIVEPSRGESIEGAIVYSTSCE